MAGQDTRTGSVSVFADREEATRHLADWLLQLATEKPKALSPSPFQEAVRHKACIA